MIKILYIHEVAEGSLVSFAVVVGDAVGFAVDAVVSVGRSFGSMIYNRCIFVKISNRAYTTTKQYIIGI